MCLWFANCLRCVWLDADNMKKRCKMMGQKRRTTESVVGSFISKGGGRAKQVAKKIRIDGEVGFDSSKGQFRGEKDGGMDAPLKGERITPCRRVVVMDTVPPPHNLN